MPAVSSKTAITMVLGVLLMAGCAGQPPSPPPPPPPALEAFPAPPPDAGTPAKPKPALGTDPESTSSTPTPGNGDDGMAGGSSFDNLDFVGSGLNGKVTVLRVGSEVGENNLLSVFAGLKNKTGHRLDLEMQTIYKDKDDNALNAGSWIAFTLQPHEEREYRSASISEQAVDFLVRVRRASRAAVPPRD